MIAFLKKRSFLIGIVLTILLLTASAFFFIMKKGILFGDDRNFNLNRLVGIAEGFKAGQFPIKYYNHMYSGHAYFNPIFYGDLFLYPFALLLLIPKVTPPLTYSLLLFSIAIAILIAGYFLFKKITKDKFLSLICANLLLLSQYTFTDIFYRGAVGESLGVLFFIILFNGIYNMLYEDYSKPYLLSTAFLGMLFSHTTSLVFGIVTILIVILINAKKLKDKKFWIKSIFAFSIFIVIGLYFIASCLEMYFSDKYLNSTQWAWPNNHKLSILEILGKSPYGLGFICLFPFILRPFIKKNAENANELKLLNFLLIVCGALIFIISNLFPWHITFVSKALSFMQFPWRLNSINCIIIVLCISLELKLLKNYCKLPISLKGLKIILSISCAVIFALFTITNNLNLYKQRKQDATYYSANSFWLFELMPIKIVNADVDDTSLYDDKKNKVDYDREKYVSTITFDADNTSSYYEIPLIYYKGYSATIIEHGKTKSLKVMQADNGKVKVVTNGKTGKVKVWYSGTTIQNLTFPISVIGAVGFASFGIYIFVKKKKQKMQSTTEIIENENA